MLARWRDCRVVSQEHMGGYRWFGLSRGDVQFRGVEDAVEMKE